MSGEKVNRRIFLDYIIGGSFAILGLAATGTVIAYTLPPRKRAGGVAGRTEIAPVDELPEGGWKKILHRGQPVIVGHARQGFFALSAVCTHLGCIVHMKGDAAACGQNMSENQIHCVCHGAVFNTRGNVLAGPAPRPLPGYEVFVSGGKVYVGDIATGGKVYGI